MKTVSYVRYLSVASAVLVALGVSSASASTMVTGTNTITGPESINLNTTDITDTVHQVVMRVADVMTNLTSSVNTGYNTGANNTTLGGLTSGSASVGGSLVTDVNNGWLPMMLPLSGDTVVSTGNGITGPNSLNDNKVEIEGSLSSVLSSVAKVATCLNFDVNTGHNKANDNTLAGGVMSGDASFWVNEANVVNSGAAMPVIIGGGSVLVGGTNTTTGPQSINKNSVDIDNAVASVVVQKADVMTGIRVKADTGDNEAKNNTQVGGLTSGAIKGSVTVANVANTSPSQTVVLPTALVASTTGNNLTGPNSLNVNKVDVDSMVSSTISQQADLHTMVTENLNSGHNVVANNTLAGGVSSGPITTDFTVVNHAN